MAIDKWVTPHTFRKTVGTPISEATTSELASRQLGHSSSQITRDHSIAKPAVAADLSLLLETLAQDDETPPTSSHLRGLRPVEVQSGVLRQDWRRL